MAGFLKRLHPLTKLGVNLLVLAFSLAWVRPGAPACTLAVGLLLLLLAGVAPGALARFLLYLSPLVAVWLVTGALFAASPPGSPPLWRLGPWVVTEHAAWWGLTRTLRILCVLTYGWLFLQTTSPTDLTLSLIQSARLPASWGFAFLAALGTVPQLRTDLRTIQAARYVRGLGSPSTPLGAARHLAATGVSLLAAAIRRSERMALAMEARAFGAYPCRTYLRTYRYRPTDALALVATGAVLLALSV